MFEGCHLRVLARAARLERLLVERGVEPRRRPCPAVEGLLLEVEELRAGATAQVFDAGLVAAVRQVERYGLAAYGPVISYARILGDREAARTLEQVLEDGLRLDSRLGDLAERMATVRAFSVGGPVAVAEPAGG